MFRTVSSLRAVAWASVLVLAACAQDSEDAMRAKIGAWLSLGETVHFESSMDCTAAVFKANGPLTRSVVQSSGVLAGIELLNSGQPVAFILSGQSPHVVSERITSASLPDGVAILSSGVTGAKCLSDDLKQTYANTLVNPRARFIFDKDGRTLALFDADAHLLFVLRGDA